MTTLPSPPPDGNDRGAAASGARVLSTGTDTGRKPLYLRPPFDVAGPANSAGFRAGGNRNNPLSPDSPSPTNPRSGSRRQRGRR